MNKVIYIVVTLALCFVAFKYGDSRGYEAGYKVGYSYDCREEIKTLRASLEDFKKSLEFSKAETYRVVKGEVSRQKRYDSLVNVHGQKSLEYNRKIDSLEKIDGVKRMRMTPTGLYKIPGSHLPWME